MSQQIFDRLVQYDGSLTIVPSIAESWKGSRDGLEWIFYLRKGVKFHNGREVTFCRWLSEHVGGRAEFSLPTEAQWEWACRAGTSTPFSFGARDADFSPWANLADASFSKGLGKDGKQVTGGLEHLVLEGATLSDVRFNDRAVVTAEVGSFQPNAWGLHDLHGNAAEWTEDCWIPNYEGAPSDGSARTDGECKERVVRGGSFEVPPKSIRSAHRDKWPANRGHESIGFRVVREE